MLSIFNKILLNKSNNYQIRFIHFSKNKLNLLKITMEFLKFLAIVKFKILICFLLFMKNFDIYLLLL